MYQYTAYGLGIRSTLPLTVLAAGGGADAADVEIRSESLAHAAADLRASGRFFSVEADEFRLVWDSFGALVVRGGREIIVDPLPELHHGDVQLLMLGLGLAALLQQRGFLLLHGSAVVMDGRAVAFLGASGRGKSTMAAALHARGHRMLVDDLVAIRCLPDGPLAYAGFPEFKLWPDAVAALHGDEDALPRIAPDYDKRHDRVDGGFSADTAVPLGNIYLLAEGEEPAIEPVSSREAFLQLSSHSYAVQWFHQLSGRSEFQTRAALARDIPVRRLRRPRQLGLLPDIIELVEDDVSRPR